MYSTTIAASSRCMCVCTLMCVCVCYYFIPQLTIHQGEKHCKKANTELYLCLVLLKVSSRTTSRLLSTLHRTLHQQFESYKQEVRRIGAETRRQQTQQKDDAPTCGICHKTKFANGCGHLCSYCQTKFCARCGGRVSLRSNNVRKPLWPFFHPHRQTVTLI